MGGLFSREKAPVDSGDNSSSGGYLGAYGRQAYDEISLDNSVGSAAPGLGGPGLPPRNPIVSVIRVGVGQRGAGEDKSVHFNTSYDPRGESPAVLAKLDKIPHMQQLENIRAEEGREGQIEALGLRNPRRIAY